MIKNVCFEILADGADTYARVADEMGNFIFVWYRDDQQRATIPVGVVQRFATWISLTRQFNSPYDLNVWYQDKLSATQTTKVLSHGS